MGAKSCTENMTKHHAAFIHSRVVPSELPSQGGLLLIHPVRGGSCQGGLLLIHPGRLCHSPDQGSAASLIRVHPSLLSQWQAAQSGRSGKLCTGHIRGINNCLYTLNGRTSGLPARLLVHV